MEKTYGPVREYIKANLQKKVVEPLIEFIKIDNLSKAYDTEFFTNGKIQKACNFCLDHAHSMELKGLTLSMHTRPERTPLVFGEVAATDDSGKNVFLYGHLDKQPHLEGWMQGTGPVTPAIINERLYGRGGADDGYSIFTALLLIKALQENNIAHPRFVLFFETDEESGAHDTPFWIEEMKAEIGTPDLVFILDSGAVDHEHFTITSSLRGNAAAILSVKIINGGVHSGQASGIIPDTFRIIRQILSRFEDPITGNLHVPECYVTIPPTIYEQNYNLSKIIGDGVFDLPFLEGAQAVTNCPFEALLNNGWRPYLSVTGADGLPPTAIAGNVCRPETKLKLSIRLPPTADAEVAKEKIKKLLEDNPPYNAKVECNFMSANPGWCMSELKPEFRVLVEESAKWGFGEANECQYLSMGGSIPLVGMMNVKFPEASFMVTGCLGPDSNAHCPDENLHLGTLEKFAYSMSMIFGECSKKL